MATQYPARYGEVSAFVPVQFYLPGKAPVFNTFTILAGQRLVPGSVLGVVTASGKLKLSASAAGDGSEVPRYVVVHQIDTYAADDTTPEDKTASVLVEAYLNENVLKFGAGHTLAGVKSALADVGIHCRAPGYSG